MVDYKYFKELIVRSVYSLEEMRRKRIKAAKKARLAKIKELQSQIKKDEPLQDRLQNEPENIDATIKEGMKKVNKTLMKKDDRFKNVIGKITKIKRKADNEKVKEEERAIKKKKKDKKKNISISVK